VVWAFRLGSFLAIRVHWYGSDFRFDTVLKNPRKFFNYWMIQGVWVFLTSLPVLYFLQQEDKSRIELIDSIGLGIWLFGFLYETIADYHKFYFRIFNPNKKNILQTGLFKYSRSPNYFGEITLWWGAFIFLGSDLLFPFNIGSAGLLGSPVFVTFMLSRVSGVPLLTKANDKKYGSDPAYLAYKASTPALIPTFLNPTFSPPKTAKQ